LEGKTVIWKEKSEEEWSIIENKNVLITGGCGFIGSNLAEELSKKNNVIIFDDLSSGNKDNIKESNVNFIEGSIIDPDRLKNTAKDMDYIFHLAAIASVSKSVKEPKLVHEVNGTGTLNVLMAAKEFGIKKVVFASSSAVYGDNPSLPLKEDLIPDPLSPYTVSKLTGEYYCEVFHKVYNLPTTSLRFFNVYGPRQDPKSEYAAVIPKFIQQVSEDKPPVIFGDGNQSRDFIYVGDVVKALGLAAESSKANGQAVNIGRGVGISINKLADKIIQVMGKDATKEYSEKRPGDIEHSVADIMKARDLIGFNPDYSLDKGLVETIGFLKN
jgi:UDP-glucose 4-epimerase